MLEPLMNWMGAARRARAQNAALLEWGEAHGLVFEAGKDGAFSMLGEWNARAVRIEWRPASRPYIAGQELWARFEAGVDPQQSVVLLNRSLKRGIERWGDHLYSQLTNALQTMADSLPEEVRWLASFRDAGWNGPDTAFWARYAVLTDALETARHWIDEDTAARLMRWPDDVVQPDTPLMLMRLRGKLQMRLQLNQPRHVPSELAALDTFAHLCRRAVLAEGGA